MSRSPLPNGIPISEYTVQSYVRGALYRKDADISQLVLRVVPQAVGMTEQDMLCLAEYAVGVYQEFSRGRRYRSATSGIRR
jgi:hypothetical protein